MDLDQWNRTNGQFYYKVFLFFFKTGLYLSLALVFIDECKKLALRQRNEPAADRISHGNDHEGFKHEC